MMGGVSPEMCWASYKYGIINSDTLLHLIGFFCMNRTMMHGSTNINSKWHFRFLFYTSYVALDDGNSSIISINNYKRCSVKQKRQDLPHTNSPILDSQYYQLYQCGTAGLLQWLWHMDQIYLYPEHQSPSSSAALLQQHVHVTRPNKQQ